MDQLEIRNKIAELDSEILNIQGLIRNVDATKNRKDKYTRFHESLAPSSHAQGPGITFVTTEEAAAHLLRSMPKPPSREELHAQLRELEHRKHELQQALGCLSADVCNK